MGSTPIAYTPVNAGFHKFTKNKITFFSGAVRPDQRENGQNEENNWVQSDPTASAAALPAQISTINATRASLERRIRDCREIPKAIAREMGAKAVKVQAILDGGPAAILREARLKKRRRVQANRRAAVWLKQQDAKDAAARAALPPAEPGIDAEASALSRNVLLPGMPEEAARKTDAGLRSAIEKQRRPVG